MATELQNHENGKIVLQNGDVRHVDGPDDMSMTGDVDPICALEDPSKPIRLIRKAKRFNRTNSGGDASSADTLASSLPLTKNSRKSRDGRGRGDPKKGKLIAPSTMTVYEFVSCSLMLANTFVFNYNLALLFDSKQF